MANPSRPRFPPRRGLAVAAVALVFLAACGSGEEASDDAFGFVGGEVIRADLSQPMGDPLPAPQDGDRAQDALAAECESGELQSCDDLFQRGAVDSVWYVYGFSCGGRLVPPPGPGEASNCRLRGAPRPRATVGDEPDGSSPRLSELAVQCAAPEGLEDCDALYRASDAHSTYESYGTTCGYRTLDDTRPNTCVGYYGIPVGKDPGNLGDDAELDDLAEHCFAGRVASCDDLYARSDRVTPYRTYAATCGGRLAEIVEGVSPNCDLRFSDRVTARVVTPPDDLGGDEALDELVTACAEGSMASCDELFELSEVNSDYEAYGATCGRRLESQRFDLSLDPLTDLEFDRNLDAAGECEARVVFVPERD